MTTTFRLKSVPMVYTPGLVKWAKAYGNDLGGKVLKEGFPGLTDAAVAKLMAGDYTVDGETVVVTA